MGALRSRVKNQFAKREWPVNNHAVNETPKVAKPKIAARNATVCMSTS